MRRKSGWGHLSLKNKKERSNEKKKKWSQPRMRLDLPPGGFLRPPAAALAPPDGSEGCGTSFCCCSGSCCSTSSAHSTDATKRKRFVRCHASWSNLAACGE